MPPFRASGKRDLAARIQPLLVGSMTAMLEAVTILSLILVSWNPALLTAAPGPARTRSSPDALTGEEQGMHVLNRLTYGPRPGDVDRIEKMGIKTFIEEQLHPESLPDAAVDPKLADLATLTMSSSELALAYPPPQAVKALQERQREAVDRPDDKSPGEMMSKDDTGKVPAIQLPAVKLRNLESVQAELARNPNMKFEGPREIVKELQQAKVLRAVYSERQLYEEMVDFWENHFNVFAGKGADRWLLTEYDRDVIRPNALGKFQDLLEATAHSPAMLFYLDNWLSADPNGPHSNKNAPPYGRNRPYGSPRSDQWGRPIPPRGVPNQTGPAQNDKKQKRGLNENYARELMELHTLGVGGGCTQKDVTEVARCFTGWTIRQPRQGGEFFFDGRFHDNGTKMVLGHKIHAGGEKDGEEVINILVHHPSTAHLIARKLVTRFVSDNPPEALVDRAAATYMKTNGDIREILRTIFYSAEFNSREAYRAKVKSPFELVVSAIRASGGETAASVPLLQFIARMGQPLFMYQAPTGYPDRASEWLNTGTLLTRMNFALALAANRIPGTTLELSNLLGDASPSQEDDIQARLLQVYLRGEVSDQTRAALDQGIAPSESERTMQPGAGMPPAAGRNMRAVETAGLILGSPEFQRR